MLRIKAVLIRFLNWMIKHGGKPKMRPTRRSFTPPQLRQRHTDEPYPPRRNRLNL